MVTVKSPLQSAIGVRALRRNFTVTGLPAALIASFACECVVGFAPPACGFNVSDEESCGLSGQAGA
jgi:hypothetical protein